MIMRTRVVKVSANNSEELEKEINRYLKEFEDKGWNMRGVPILLYNDSYKIEVLLTLEKMMEV